MQGGSIDARCTCCVPFDRLPEVASARRSGSEHVVSWRGFRGGQGERSIAAPGSAGRVRPIDPPCRTRDRAAHDRVTRSRRSGRADHGTCEQKRSVARIECRRSRYHVEQSGVERLPGYPAAAQRRCTGGANRTDEIRSGNAARARRATGTAKAVDRDDPTPAGDSLAISSADHTAVRHASACAEIGRDADGDRECDRLDHALGRRVPEADGAAGRPLGATGT